MISLNPPPIDVISAQAQLLANRTLRAAFRHDPVATARQMGVSNEDVPVFASLSADQLETQAQALLAKRQYEVKRFLPRSFAGLGESARRHFLAYAETFWPTGHRRHFHDAVAFSEYLNRHQIRGGCRMERNWLRFRAQRALLRVHWVHAAPVGSRHHRGLQILFIWRSRPGQWLLHLPF